MGLAFAFCAAFGWCLLGSGCDRFVLGLLVVHYGCCLLEIDIDVW